jgi:signal transduction histidine kinase/ligand-binding sensor domain-containing protein/DNA-binding response OmpR family regulator
MRSIQVKTSTIFQLSVFLILMLAGAQVWANDDFGRNMHFAKIDRGNGLSHNQIHSIMQDSRGFIWVGTMSGLNRLDGSKVKVFKYTASQSHSLPDNNIVDVWEDHRGILWVNTTLGLSFFDPETETFRQSDTIKFGRYILNLTNFNNFYRDNQGGIWVMTTHQGVQYGNSQNNSFYHYVHNASDSTSIYSNNVYGIAQNSSGDVWMVHNYGVADLVDVKTQKVKDRVFFLPFKHSSNYFRVLVDADDRVWIWADNNAFGAFCYDPTTRKTLHFSTRSETHRIASDIVTDVIQDDEGLIWIATDHGGIALWNPKMRQLRSLVHEPFNQNSLIGNSIVELFKDRNGAIWIGTFKDGINKYHKDVFRFNIIKDNPLDATDLGFEDVNCVVSDKLGNVWFGTNGGGLVRYDKNSGKYVHFKHDKSNPNSISNDVIVSIKVDSENNLWIGTFYGGLNKWDGSRFHRFQNDPDRNESLSDNRVWSIYEDRQRNLWVGTLGGGLNLFDRKTNAFTHYKVADVNSVSSDYIFGLTEDHKGNLWIATALGVSRFVYESGRFINYRHDPNQIGSLAHDNSTCLLFDSKQNLWFGTREGLCRYDFESDHFEVFNEQNGLPDNSIVSLVEDDLGAIWIGTAYNLTRMYFNANSKTERLSLAVFNQADGLQAGEFNVNSAYKTTDGALYFGGTKGVNYFKPVNLEEKKFKGEVIISDFKVFNNSIHPGQELNGRVLLERALFVTKSIKLKHRENAFSIAFSDLSFIDDDQQFYYKLEGFNDQWIQADKKNKEVHFTNLSPGDYTFVVRKASTPESSEFSETSLKIRIQPPFWKSFYAYLFYMFFIVGTLEVLRQMVINRERKKTDIVRERERQNMQQEMDMLKMRFFTNISHELKTPLSLILSPLESLLKEAKDERQYAQYQMIHRNASRLFNMVNQLLDFRKMDAGQVDLNLAEGDLNTFIKDTVDSFVEMANKKDIDLRFYPSESQLFTSFDKRKVERIMFNLLSNAFKFTAAKGYIEVLCCIRPIEDYVNLHLKSDSSKVVLIQVKDTGIGIQPENLDRVFERFFQEHGSNSEYNEGSGIGLSIVREYAQVHGGEVLLESTPGLGTTFSIVIPYHESKQKSKFLEAELDVEEEEKGDERPTILVVDDNDDFRAYIRQNLDPEYRVIEAANGAEGIQVAVDHVPDLIISDIMMPVLDGIEMCKQLKSDFRTSHVPIILLTAVNNQQKMLDGFEIGADDYMTKPFNPDILASRVRNLIGQREKLQSNFKLQMQMTPKDIQVTTLDEKLINKAIEVVEANISNPDFSVAELSQELGMSRVNLYKKLKSLTGHTPIEFIRTFRIKRAAQLLAQSQMGVSEAAYQVGFNDPRYFTRYFKAEFKMLPSEYAKKNKPKSE